jgi:hypothetical protein
MAIPNYPLEHHKMPSKDLHQDTTYVLGSYTL